MLGHVWSPGTVPCADPAPRTRFGSSIAHHLGLYYPSCRVPHACGPEATLIAVALEVTAINIEHGSPAAKFPDVCRI